MTFYKTWMTHDHESVDHPMVAFRGKHAGEAAKEVQALAAAFDKRLTAKCTCSTQLRQQVMLLAAIKQDHHLNAINSLRQTANHLLTPSAHQPNSVKNIKQPQHCITSLNQASFLPKAKKHPS